MKPYTLEIVLNELLEEQKRQTIGNAELVSVVKKMVDTIHAIQEQIKQVNLSDSSGSLNNKIPEIEQLISEMPHTLKGFNNLLSNVAPNINKFNTLTGKIEQLLLHFHAPAKTKIEHRHQLHKGMWLCATFFSLSILLGWCWLNAKAEKEQFEANDIKYRSLKVSGNLFLIRSCALRDSLYLNSKDAFSSSVKQEEFRLYEQAELLRLAAIKKEEAKDLENRAGRNIPMQK